MGRRKRELQGAVPQASDHFASAFLGRYKVEEREGTKLESRLPGGWWDLHCIQSVM